MLQECMSIACFITGTKKKNLSVYICGQLAVYQGEHPMTDFRQ